MPQPYAAPRLPNAPDRDILQPRRRPTQKRALLSYERILDAAREILREGDETSLTTTAVAERARVGVGSLYAYFPNKEAIVAALFERKLHRIRSAIAGLDRFDPARMAWQEFGEAIGRTMKQAEDVHEINFMSLNIVVTSPQLTRLDRAHAEWVANRYAQGMRLFGSRWPDDALLDLGLNIYALDAFLQFYGRLLGDRSDLANERAITASLAMMEPAMTHQPVPAGPFISRQFPPGSLDD